MKINKIKIIKVACVVMLISMYILTRYFHSFYQHAEGYGSGDAYRVILSAFSAETNGPDVYMISYFYKIAHELTNISYYQISFYTTPFIGLLIILLIFDIIRRDLGFIPSALASLILILNPWLAYHSTEPSKEIFVLLFILFVIYFLFRFEKTKIYNWLLMSFFSFAAGTIYYHSIVIFLPLYILAMIYFLVKIYKNNEPIRHIIISLIIFFGMILVIAGPQYIIKEINYRSSLAEKPVFLKTDIDQQGNVFQRQFGAMFHALIYDREKLGIFKLTEGVDTFILNQYELIYLFIVMIIISLFLFKTRKTYIPLLFCTLTIYAFIIIGLQWTSYSHTSRYPQYIIYFFLLCISLPLTWAINLLRHKKVELLILAFLVTLLFLVFDPFIKVDVFRNIYSPHKQIGVAAKSKGIRVDNNNQVLYLGWPSVTLSLLENFSLNANQENYLHTFGWDLVDLKGVSSKNYVKKENIKYFIYNETGSDYFNSNQQVYSYLKTNFLLTPISYVTEDKQSIIIYKINYL